VTIVVLIILATISINIAVGDEGVIKKAETAKEMMGNAQELERLELMKASMLMDKDAYGNITPDSYVKYLEDQGMILDKKYNEDESTEIITDKGYVVLIKKDSENEDNIIIEIEGKTDEIPVRVTDISINPEAETVEWGKTVELTATVTPSNADDTSVTWSSSDENIATVSSDGVVTAKKQGTVTITATANDGSRKSGSCEVTVEVWETLSKIAKEISNNYGTETGKYNHTTETITVAVDNVSYTLNVGDEFELTDTSNNSYTVRILGFNHDKLTSTSAYGGTNTYAGISFEFVDLLNVNGSTRASMNSTNTNTGGWGACELRTTLNSTEVINTLTNKS